MTSSGMSCKLFLAGRLGAVNGLVVSSARPREVERKAWSGSGDGVERFEDFEKARIVTERREVRVTLGPGFEPRIAHGERLVDELHGLVGIAESQCGPC